MWFALDAKGQSKVIKEKEKSSRTIFTGVEDMADLLCENFVVVIINNSLNILATCMSIKVLAI